MIAGAGWTPDEVVQPLVDSGAALVPPRAVDSQTCRTECIRVGSEVWQARIDSELAAQLREDAKVLGLKANTDIVKAGLQLLHRQAAEQVMAHGIRDFYDGQPPPLPIGVRRSKRRTPADSEAVADGR
ncbi:MAG: hypothetical protein M3P46_09100 [Actinomycetota bacterium]|nr:hypothetical protein [Actinomycetota bacterium]